jgi:hypothetical protein
MFLDSHYRKPAVCRVFGSLPSAFYHALGKREALSKVVVCRVPEI